MSKNILAIDVGGTTIKYALCNQDCELSNKGSVNTPDNLEQFYNEIENIYKNAGEVEGIALSMPGAVDSNTGIIHGISFVPYIHGPNIKEDLLESEDSNLINESNINNNLELNPLSIKNKGKNIQSGKSKKSNNDKNFEEYQNSNPVLDDFNSNENLGKSKINNTNINDNESVNSSDFIDLSSLAKGGKYYFFY